MVTMNQIEWWKLQESKRSNLANEAIQRNYTEGTVDVNRGQLDVAKGRLGLDTKSFEEAVRHNKMSEQISGNINRETKRHNLMQEQISGNINRETKRHNLVQEAIGSNQAYASLLNAQASQSQAGASWKQANVGERQLEINKLGAITEWRKVGETTRHNTVVEGYEGAYKNMAESKMPFDVGRDMLSIFVPTAMGFAMGRGSTKIQKFK